MNDAILQPVRTYRQRNFLEMQQPIQKDHIAPYEVLEIGFLYKIPFTFIVPDRLPIHACRHGEKHWDVQNSHLALPPTMGCLNYHTKSPANDDSCPGNLSISYAVEARLAGKHAGTYRSKEPWNFSSKEIAVTPLYSEHIPEFEPDLVTSQKPSYASTPNVSKSTDYKLQLEFLGALPLEHFFFSHADDESCVNTVPLKVKFNSTVCTSPPKLSQISRNIVVHTEVHAVPFRASNTGPIRESKCRAYTSTVPLGNLDVSSVKWEACPPAIPDSNLLLRSTSASDQPAERGKQVDYEMVLQVPISIPRNTKLVPSFDSCLISRTYSLEICLAYQKVGITGSSFVNIQLPLKIGKLQ